MRRRGRPSKESQRVAAERASSSRRVIPDPIVAVRETLSNLRNFALPNLGPIGALSTAAAFRRAVLSADGTTVGLNQNGRLVDQLLGLRDQIMGQIGMDEKSLMERARTALTSDPCQMLQQWREWVSPEIMAMLNSMDDAVLVRIQAALASGAGE